VCGVLFSAFLNPCQRLGWLNFYCLFPQVPRRSDLCSEAGLGSALFLIIYVSLESPCRLSLCHPRNRCCYPLDAIQKMGSGTSLFLNYQAFSALSDFLQPPLADFFLFFVFVLVPCQRLILSLDSPCVFCFYLLVRLPHTLLFWHFVSPRRWRFRFDELIGKTSLVRTWLPPLCSPYWRMLPYFCSFSLSPSADVPSSFFVVLQVLSLSRYDFSPFSRFIIRPYFSPIRDCMLLGL